MSLTKEWVPFQDRTTEVKETAKNLVTAVNRKIRSEYIAERVYEDYGWGQLESSYLYRALMMMQRETRLFDKEEIVDRIPIQTESQETEGSIFEDQGDEVELPTPDRITRSLNWFRAASQEKAIRELARNEYEQRLLALFVEHVESTGETFYPEMQSILANEYDFTGDS
jgi:hypothetical protein